jgi:hypothetical protein
VPHGLNIPRIEAAQENSPHGSDHVKFSLSVSATDCNSKNAENDGLTLPIKSFSSCVDKMDAPPHQSRPALMSETDFSRSCTC